MKICKTIIAATLMSLATVGFAQTKPQIAINSAPGKVSASGTVKTTATVVRIEPSTRTVWLKDAKGEIADLVVGPEARNFDQIKVGDVVTAEYSQAITVTLKKSAAPLAASEAQRIERAPLGAKPGGTVHRAITIMANVTAINHQTGAVTLQGPQGNSVDLIVQDPSQLELIKTGDQMEVHYDEAMAISVEAQAR